MYRELPLLGRSGFVDHEVTLLEFHAIQLGDGFPAFRFIGHFNKAETTASARFTVGNDFHGGDFPVLLE